MSYPASIDSIPNVPTNTNLNGPPDHTVLHNQVSVAVESLEAKVGIGASTPATGQVLTGTSTGSVWAAPTTAPVSSVFGRTGAVTAQSGDYTYTQVGADASGAASTAQTNAESFATSAVATETTRAETAEALLAPKASPALTGTPSAPTASPSTNTTQLATTAFVEGEIATNATPDATTSSKGKIQLAGDLGGTAAAPTVNAATFTSAGKVKQTVYNVKDYGAAGDGTTDDKTAIQNAINAANGGIVYLPQSTYIISGPLKFNSNTVVLRGAGMGKTIIKAKASYASFGLIYDFTSGLANCVVEHITFDSNAQAVSAIQFGTCNNMRVQYCEVTNKTGQQWSVAIGQINDSDHDSSASYNIIFANNYVHDNGTGTNEVVLAVNCRESMFDRNYFLNNTNTAFTLNLYGYCYGTSACNNTFNNTANAIYVLSSRNNTVNSNNIACGSTGQRGIDISNSHYVTVADNMISLFTSAGIGGTGVWCYNYGGTFDAHTSLYSDCRYINITNNIIQGGYYGINLGRTTNFAQVNDTNITGNLVDNMAFSCVVMGHNTNDCQMVNIRFEHNTFSNSNVFSGNGVIDLTGYTTDPTKVSGLTFIGNKVYPTNNGSVHSGGDTACGIRLSAASNVVLIDNDVTGSGYGLSEITLQNGTTVAVQVDNLGSNSATTNSTFAGNISVPSLQVGTSATSGYVLTADSSGNATWQSASGDAINRTITSISSPITAGATAKTDYVYLVSGTTALTLPTAVGNTNRYTVTNVGTNTVTVATTSAQTVNGSSTATLPIANMSLDFISDNANWHIE